ncbi:chemotaxis protein CheW [Denitromonas iodatirespirans]|uniref:Purine-binding chemotaxis protein CheW n=1 Tax=Denitromonas iodatirespirans TaxID=2795389 RepID=A0A944HAN0_DENI1|nr:chemotaxis protein CheW [Denitromonas iodatirespirans]MBT0959561.1 purine-binding chemotaxis protein CheW [Denitromonas iodatirespirans]
MTRPDPIDWDAVKQRIEAAGQRLEEEFAPPADKRRALLEARARALAVAPAPAPGAGFDALEFTLAREHYAIDTVWVREVYPLREFTQLPGTPAFVLGIVHVRGRVVSVLDLKRFFDMPQIGLSDLNKVIVLSNGTMEFGILADTIVGVRRLLHAEVQEALPTLTGIRADYLLGITSRREVVLDAHKLLSDPAIVVCADVGD